MTIKNPSATWYFTDWENDPALKTCSLAAQGLWKRLICIAARSPEHGVVQMGSLTSSLPEGLTHIASAVGKPPEEIAPLIDELLSSGTASRDRKGRIYCRRMKRAAALSDKRSIAGKLGAEATNGKQLRKPDLPQQNSRQTGGPSRLPDFKSSSHGDISTDAARASASPDGPPRPRLLDGKWLERLNQYRPWLPHGDPLRGHWTGAWGVAPDSAGRNPHLPEEALRTWRETRATEIAKQRAAA